ncbi:DNA polymerase III subunit delta' [Qipengyuania sp. ASV99]|uniref:DNA polymerase III subunit delta' n=1 Tax=Qipengyuania sp. ASV99 TaxID=3399681 RepID=UPI003A4C6DD9
MTDWPNHDAAWREWRTAMAGERMHHGWLLAGKRGLGKLDFALAAARELVVQDNSLTNNNIQPVTHPDIHIVTYSAKDDKEEKKRQNGNPYELSKQIRERDIGHVQARLRTRPTLGERRVVIITPADDMNTHAANKLLKSLEEPPAGTFFILVTHRPSRLLPTIRSRCRILRLPELSDLELEAMLLAAGQGGDLTPAIRAAQGSYGAAVRFAEMELAPIAALIERLLLRGDADFNARADLVRLIGPRADRERLQAVMDLAQAMVADHAKSTGNSSQRSALIDAHAQLVALAAQAPTYNFDTGLLTLEIGSLLMRAAPASERAHG